MLKRLVLLIGIPFAISVLSCSKSTQQISSATKPSKENVRAFVFTPPNADPITLKAAEEFKKYYNQIFKETPNELKVVISPISSSILEQHRIQYFSDNNTLYIHGGSPQATLHAVYSFLERELDCNFLIPDVEIIPKKDAFEINGCSYEYMPSITTRTVHSRLFYENPDFAAKHRVTENAFPRYVPKARVHTFQHFLPAEQHLKKHPEYYALRNGKRRSTQLCLTNEKVFQIVRDSVAQFLLDSPESDVISVSQDDNTLYCQCQDCERIHREEESASGSMIYFVNKIAKEFPNKQISTLAYQYTRKAPKYIKPEPNVLITLCSIECDRSAPIAEKCTDFADDLIAWGKITDNIRIWDYTTQFTNFLAPFPNLHTLQPNIQLFKQNNAKWVFEQHSRNPSELFELRSFLTAKLLWNPNADADSIKQVFLESYYEEAAPFVKKYIDQIHHALADNPDFFLFLYGDPSQGFESFLSAENLSRYNAIYDSAETKVMHKPEVLERVKIARLSIDYASLEFAKKNMRASLAVSDNILQNKIKSFETTTREGKITAMNEMRFTVEEYLQQYRQTLNRAKKVNLGLNKGVTLLTSPKKYAKEDPQVLTDGAYGGSSFFSNWLGFEGNHLEAVIDLEKLSTISEISSAFLQVTNHIVFFPTSVEYLGSTDGIKFKSIATIPNTSPLTKQSKINDIAYFDHSFAPQEFRFIKIKAVNMNTAPEWHNSSGLPSWIFIDEVEVR